MSRSKRYKKSYSTSTPDNEILTIRAGNFRATINLFYMSETEIRSFFQRLKKLNLDKLGRESDPYTEL